MKNGAFLIRECAWHTAKGQQPLAGFAVTHSICPICFELMKHPTPDWPRMLQEGGWSRIPLPADNFWPQFERMVRGKIHIIRNVGPAEPQNNNAGWWELFIENGESRRGTLSEMLNASDDLSFGN